MALAQATKTAIRAALADHGNAATEVIDNLGLVEDISAAEIAFLDGVTAGTATASKAVVLDGSKGIATITSATITTLTTTTVTGSGAITSSSQSAGIGYATGAGGAVTQMTNRTTGVTVNTICGTITTDATSLAAEAVAKFTVTNSRVAVGDCVIVTQQSGAVGVATVVEVVRVAAGAFDISVMNGNAAGGTAETGAILINFAIIKAVSA